MKHLSFLALLLPFCVHADQVQVAVAANFTGPMQVIAALFERDTGHKASLSYGATGKFYAQIANGAPFEIMLSADEAAPARMIKEGHALAGTAFTYAIGKLVLWSADPKLIDSKGAILRKGGFKHIALANPKTAPYGAAAQQVMDKLGVADALKPLIVQGENIAQAHQFVFSGSAELGFVAYAQVIKNGQIGSGSGWLVPDNLYAPIRQDAVLLNKGKDKPAALALLDYLKGDKAQTVIRAFGYELR